MALSGGERSIDVMSDRTESSDGRPRRLFLFDIDGTLLKCGPQIREIFESALVEVFGTAGPIDSYDFAGKTDHGIVGDLMRSAGLEPERTQGLRPVFQRLYLERLEERLDGRRMRLMPGLPAVLERLAARSDVALGLLTGNFAEGARIKLSRLGLEHFFPFGAFGDEVASRLDLPPLALERARISLGEPVAPENAVVVGDSVLDVACAQAHGLGCIAVTTGFATRDELVSAGAEWVVEDLLEAERRYLGATGSRHPQPSGERRQGPDGAL